MTDLNDLDRRIAELESSLAEDPPGQLESSDDSDEDTLAPSTIKPTQHPPDNNKRKRASSPAVLGATFAPIAPLQPSLLPSRAASSTLTSITQRGASRRKSGSNFTARRCDVCPIRTVFRTKDDWLRHRRDLLHRQNVVLRAGAVYEPSSRKPLYCRVCKLDVESEEDLHAHRRTEMHRNAVEEDRRSSYCQICRKQFTSAHQLKEHCVGKTHILTVKELKRKWRNRHPKRHRPRGHG